MPNFDFNELFKNFNHEQLTEIYLGYETNLDYSI